MVRVFNFAFVFRSCTWQGFVFVGFQVFGCVLINIISFCLSRSTALETRLGPREKGVRIRAYNAITNANMAMITIFILCQGKEARPILSHVDSTCSQLQPSTSSQSVVCVITAGLVLVVEVMIWVKAPIPIVIDLFTGFLYKSQPTFDSLLIYHLLHRVGDLITLRKFGPLTREAKRALWCYAIKATAESESPVPDRLHPIYVVDR